VAFVPHKHCNLVMGIQAGLGEEAVGTLIKLPLPEGLKPPTFKPNLNVYQYAGSNYSQLHYETGGQAMEGSLTIPLVPGYVEPTGSNPLADWIWGGGDEGDYFETFYATLYLDRGNDLVEKFMDVKVKSGSVKVDFGSNYAAVELSLLGCAKGVIDSFSDPDPDLFEIRPYRYSEAAITFLGAQSFTRNHTLEFDNMIEPVEALNGTVTAAALPSAAKTQWKASFDRAFVDTDIYEAFNDETEVAYTLSLTRAGVAVAEFAMPRCIIAEHNLDVPDSGILKETGISLIALGALDNSANACIISEGSSS